MCSWKNCDIVRTNSLSLSVHCSRVNVAVVSVLFCELDNQSSEFRRTLFRTLLTTFEKHITGFLTVQVFSDTDTDQCGLCSAKPLRGTMKAFVEQIPNSQTNLRINRLTVHPDVIYLFILSCLSSDAPRLDSEECTWIQTQVRANLLTEEITVFSFRVE